MFTKYSKIIVSLCFSFFNLVISENPKLLVVSFGGFPNRLLQPSILPNLWKFAKQGVSFEYGTSPQYIVHSWPNHMSLATGLYVESHGILGDFFHNYEMNKTFDNRRLSGNKFFYEESLKPHWYRGEPIWLTNQRAGNGRSSGSMFWPMADAEIDGEFPDRLERPRSENENEQSRSDTLKQAKYDFDTLLSWFNNSINLGLFYSSFFDRPDLGPGLTSKLLGKMDSLVKYMMERLKQEKLWDTINVIILSDHGFSNVVKDNPADRNICDFINCERVLINVHSILPKGPTNMTEIYEQLKSVNKQSEKLKMNVYWKSEFPKSYHYNHSLVGPIILTGVYPHWFYMPQIGYNIRQNYPAPTFVPRFGEQKGILLMHGPAFQNGTTVSSEDVRNIDIYPLMCKILGIKESANNGSLARVKKCLVTDDGWSIGWIIFAVIAVIALVSCLIFVNYLKCRQAGSVNSCIDFLCNVCT